MIGSVIQKGGLITVYDEKGYTLSNMQVNPSDQLMGYTGSSFSVKKGNMVTVYDEKCYTLSTNYI